MRPARMEEPGDREGAASATRLDAGSGDSVESASVSGVEGVAGDRTWVEFEPEKLPRAKRAAPRSRSSTTRSRPKRAPKTGNDGERVRVLVEMRGRRVESPAAAMEVAAAYEDVGFVLDSDYEPVPVGGERGSTEALRTAGEDVVVVRGTIDEEKIEELERQEDVVKVWRDTPIAPFPCAIEPCDCKPGTAHGTIGDVVRYLRVDDIWAAGQRGNGVVIGIVDGGITALGRAPRSGETARIGRVIDGWPADWGTTAQGWGDHGNMTATDALGMAPEAQLFDIRISDGNAISSALAGFDWAIAKHRASGKPDVLSNSWGIFRESWDPAYARDPSHPFTRKVVEAVDEGILVLFAAGNCGDECPDRRCGRTADSQGDTGPGRSIWGANGHPRVMTVAAVNRDEEYIGYSSQGPASLDPEKPDFCAVSHFQGYFASDSGTSAACPVAAGVVALLKQADPQLTQDAAKKALKATAKDIGPAGLDQSAGAGIVRPKAAYDALVAPAPVRAWHGWESRGGVCFDAPAAAALGDDRLVALAVGSNRAIWQKWWDGSSWRSWRGLSGYWVAGPAVAAVGDNRLAVFAIGPDNALWQRWRTSAGWTPWEKLGGFWFEAPAAASLGPNRVDCFVVGADRALHRRSWDGSAWDQWESLGGWCTTAPAATAWAWNRLDVFAVGPDSGLWHKTWDEAGWTRWESLGGSCVSAPAAVSLAPNTLDCFVVGRDRAVWRKSWGPSGWSRWEQVGGWCLSAPAAVARNGERIDLFAIGLDRALWHNWFGTPEEEEEDAVVSDVLVQEASRRRSAWLTRRETTPV